MATPFEVPGFRIPGLLAGADLSTNQFRFVKAGATEGQVVAIAAVTDVPIGVQLDKPSAAARLVEVESFGICRCIAGATLTYGQRVQTDSQGRAIPAAATGFPVAICLTGTVNAGEHVTLAVNCFSPTVF